jgi:regulatory protein
LKTGARTAYQVAVQALSRREYALEELRAYLKRKSLDDADIEATLTMLVDKGWQSDERFAEALVRSRYLAGKGPMRIRQELQQKGVSGEIIQQALDHGGWDWETSGLRQYRKKFGTAASPDHDTWARAQRFLLYRGFSAEQVRNIRHRLQEEQHSHEQGS